MSYPKFSHEDSDCFQLGLDFDNTLVTNKFPGVGDPVPYCLDTLWHIRDNFRVQFILITLRSAENLETAAKYCFDNGVQLHGANVNPFQNDWEIKQAWEPSRKIYADLYVDDRSFGCPLVEYKEHWVVDWHQIRPMVEEILKREGFQK